MTLKSAPESTAAPRAQQSTPADAPASETSADDSGARAFRMPRNLRILAIVAAVLLVLGVGIPIAVAEVRSASIVSAAEDDAARLSAAATAADPSIIRFNAAIAVANHHDSAFISPILSVIADYGSDFDAEATGAFAESVDGLRNILGEAPVAAGLSNDFRAPALSDVLTARYLGVSDESRESLRSQARDEIDRLAAQSADLDRWVEHHLMAAHSVDAVVAQLAASVETMGAGILASHGQASAESVAALNAAIESIPAVDADALREQRQQAWGSEKAAAALAAALDVPGHEVGGFLGLVNGENLRA